jgi:hypothetical protein
MSMEPAPHAVGLAVGTEGGAVGTMGSVGSQELACILGLLVDEEGTY